MNIGIFTDAYFPQINGVVISTQILKGELEKLGHKVTIITVSDPNIIDDHQNVLRLPSIPFAVLPNFRVGTIYSRKIMKEIKSLNLDIIHTQTEFSLRLFAKHCAKKLSIPIVHTYHTMYEDYTHYFSVKYVEKYAKLLVRKFSKSICNSADHLVVPTKKVENALLYYGLKKKPDIIPTGVNLEPFDPSKYSYHEILKIRDELQIGRDDKVALFVGRIAKEKAIDVLIKSIARVKDNSKNVKLLIVGDGPERKKLEALSLELGCRSNIIFTGKVPWENIGIYYQVADVFMSASTSETQGLTYIEAMAAMKPVIAKYDTNLDDIIFDGITGRYFYEDYELDSILLGLLNDKLISRYIGKSAYDHVRKFSSEQFGLSIANVYKETLLSQRAL